MQQPQEGQDFGKTGGGGCCNHGKKFLCVSFFPWTIQLQTTHSAPPQTKAMSTHPQPTGVVNRGSTTSSICYQSGVRDMCHTLGAGVLLAEGRVGG